MKSISFLQPRHSYTPPEGQGHIYTNTSLWTAASRVIEAGGDVAQICDENLRPFEPEADSVGINLVGAPYIPVVRERMKSFIEKRLIAGGQVVNGLTDAQVLIGQQSSQFQELFGQDVVNGNNDFELCTYLGIDPAKMPDVLETSLIPAYERISDEDMHAYLSREISFFLSRGCAKRCNFCAAQCGTREEYRDFSIIEKDLRYLIKRAQDLGLKALDMYLGSLDIIQTPDELKRFALLVQKLKRENPDFEIKMRGLAGTPYFIKANRKNPDAIREIVKAGLYAIGFGVDGGTPEVWKRERKGNTKDDCIDSILLTREKYRITPEILMVFGHQKETEESLKAALDFTEEMSERYDAVPRPHIAKDIVPGSRYWANDLKDDETTEEDRADRAMRIAVLMNNPDYFYALDFARLPSSISHTNPILRKLIIEYAEAIAELPGNTTHLLDPIGPEFSNAKSLEALRNDIGKFDR
ncbi:MAG: radical SAM protein [Candidatus Peribacteraceae bacterium]|jgi:hypothetical protein|nr:radical SAM protein [Candidatus Peribacteraceae bacterium]HCI03459.1 hypothetical protein [Candidatus Peribacteria bacterium]|tara:strand:- start:770 stop:2176 length:1407 start_codon:yes stop_codon:yes gene_type:complete